MTTRPKRAPRGRFLHELTVECLDRPNLFHLGKTIGVVTPDGSVKRLPVMRVQSNIWSRFYSPDLPLARSQDAWMVEKIDAGIRSFKGSARGGLTQLASLGKVKH